MNEGATPLRSRRPNFLAARRGQQAHKLDTGIQNQLTTCRPSAILFGCPVPDHHL